MLIFPKTLVAEDDPNDALLLHRTFKRAGITATIHFVSDGVEAIDYLRGKQLFEKVASSTLPGLLLLDLDMPRLDGFGVLEWLRKHPHLRPARVVVITSMQRDQDLARAQGLGADLCLLKSSDPVELSQVVQMLRECYASHAGFIPTAPATSHSEVVSL